MKVVNEKIAITISNNTKPVLAIFFALILLVVVSTSISGVFAATSDPIYVNGSVTNPGNGSYDTPYQNIGLAVNDSNVNQSANNTIVIAPGTYSGLGNNTNLTITGNVSIFGEAYYNSSVTGETIIDAQGLSIIFAADNGTSNPGLFVNFYGITFKNGNNINGSGTGNTGPGGGAIWSNGFTLTIDNCTFINNTANQGGAVYQQGQANSFIYNSIFVNNNATNRTTINETTANRNGGGAFLVAGQGNSTVANCTFINNDAISGGAIIRDGTGVLNVYNSTFINNTADFAGGAISLANNANNPSSITNSSFYNNTGEFGGAIFTVIPLQITSCDFVNNNATTGASIYKNSENNLTVNYSRFYNNTGPFEIYNNGTNPNNTSTADFNWWGANYTANKTFNVTVNNYYVAMLNGSNETTVGDNYVYNYFMALNGTNIPDSNWTNLPSFNGTITDPATGDEEIFVANRPNNWTYEVPNAFPIIITAAVDGANLELDVTVNPVNVPGNSTTNNTDSVRNTITLSTPTINQGKKTNISLTLRDSNGKLLANQRVSITINRKTYTKITNSKGVAVFNIKNLKGGKYTVRAMFNGTTITSKVQTVRSKVDLAIVSAKKVKSSRNTVKYRVVIQNKGSLKSKNTVLNVLSKNGKVKFKAIKVKALKSGAKTTLTVTYYKNSAMNRKAHRLVLNPKKSMSEISYKNNVKTIKL